MGRPPPYIYPIDVSFGLKTFKENRLTPFFTKNLNLPYQLLSEKLILFKQVWEVPLCVHNKLPSNNVIKNDGQKSR